MMRFGQLVELALYELCYYYYYYDAWWLLLTGLSRLPSLLTCWNLPHMLILVMGLNRDSLQYNIRQTLFKDGQSELVQSILY